MAEIKKSKCPFANLFGKPGTGVHQYRIGKFAAVDIGLTIIAAYYFAKWKKKPFASTLAKLIALGIVLHRIAGVDTALNEMIFKDKINCE